MDGFDRRAGQHAALLIADLPRDAAPTPTAKTSATMRARAVTVLNLNTESSLQRTAIWAVDGGSSGGQTASRY
jgi:hypothetical protein